MASKRDTSETSPLLGHLHNGGMNGRIDSVSVDGGSINHCADASGDPECRQSVDQTRAAQFQGQPEIQQKFKYILPALLIGVMSDSVSETATVANSCRYSSQQLIKPS